MAESEIVISGEIKFTQSAPKSPLPKPSILLVQLQDCRRADGESTDIAQVEVDVHEVYVEGQPLKFSLKVPNFVYDMEYQMSAVLNIGWTPDKSKEEWIRNGDYFNDTSHPLEITDQNGAAINFDIEVVPCT